MGLLRSPEPFIFDSYKHVVPPGPRQVAMALQSVRFLPHSLVRVE
jgi:hypothetical protein